MDKERNWTRVPSEQGFEMAQELALRTRGEREQFEATFTLAGIEIQKTFLLENGYWPRHPDYFYCMSPWYLFRTSFGMIDVGWRKRVIHIGWEDTPIRQVITEDDVTKSETMVHAWTLEKMVEYLKALKAVAVNI